VKKDQFAEAMQNAGLKNLQLIRDVVTRWSSTLLMIQRLLYLRKARIVFHILYLLNKYLYYLGC
jgi:hypothetical protein